MAGVDVENLRVELARRGLNRTDLAKRLGVPTTTLSSWLTSRHPAPPDLSYRIADVLRATKVITATPE